MRRSSVSCWSSGIFRSTCPYKCLSQHVPQQARFSAHQKLLPVLHIHSASDTYSSCQSLLPSCFNYSPLDRFGTRSWGSFLFHSSTKIKGEKHDFWKKYNTPNNWEQNKQRQKYKHAQLKRKEQGQNNMQDNRINFHDSSGIVKNKSKRQSEVIVSLRKRGLHSTKEFYTKQVPAKFYGFKYSG